MDVEHELPQGDTSGGTAEEKVSEVEKLKAENAQLLDRVARQQAEFENFRKRSQRDGSGNAQGFQKWRSVGGRLPEAGTNAINSANKRRHADPRIATIPEKVTPQVRFAVIWRR